MGGKGIDFIEIGRIVTPEVSVPLALLCRVYQSSKASPAPFFTTSPRTTNLRRRLSEYFLLSSSASLLGFAFSYSYLPTSSLSIPFPFV
ncbi:hypothetical protein BDQ12DRAFT_679326 [Crucibulum laeve]|uniref:Uncharacterized protein n=1 Tax=Crucibulum laeve TaxID=68775 RepID=A0A5C3M906_9AGAR|nr:hypothetical protein BDQ12DRAFT_679326 [Crucibulum laeve]